MSEKGFPEVRLKVNVESESVKAGRRLRRLLGRAFKTCGDTDAGHDPPYHETARNLG